jgi:hypothetical protein
VPQLRRRPLAYNFPNQPLIFSANISGPGVPAPDVVGLRVHPRLRRDQAGQLLALVPGLATSTATGIARRFTGQRWRGAESGLASVTARMVSLLPAERAAELAEGPVTIDIDATDVEVYGSEKRGVAYNYQGQRAGRPHVASWAETEIPLSAEGPGPPRKACTANPARHPGCHHAIHAGRHPSKIIRLAVDNVRRSTRGFGFRRAVLASG